MYYLPDSVDLFLFLEVPKILKPIYGKAPPVLGIYERRPINYATLHFGQAEVMDDMIRIRDIIAWIEGENRIH